MRYNYTKGLEINLHYAEAFTSNCPVMERTADGIRVGTCTFYMKDGETCPRHGRVRSRHGIQDQ